MRYLILLVLLVTACSARAVQEGDTVGITYTGSFTNGSVFDSNDPAHGTQRPFVVTVGAHQVIPGFEDALYGMRKGETKTVTIPAAQAYGAYDASKRMTLPAAITAPRTQTVRRELAVPIAMLDGQNDTFSDDAFQYTVIARNATHGTLRIENATSTFRIPDTWWDSELVVIGDDELTFRAVVADGDTLTTPYGPFMATLNASHILLRTTLNVGDALRSETATVRVTEVTPETVVLDANHPLAGQELVFSIRVDTIANQ